MQTRTNGSNRPLRGVEVGGRGQGPRFPLHTATVPSALASMGGDFPYRRYLYGMASADARLTRIVHEPIAFERKIWRLPRDKIRARTPDFFERYPTLDLVVGKGDWVSDEVVDLYTEGSRMGTPGYGEKQSPVELHATNPRLLFERVNATPRTTPEELREMIYKSIGEARLAYASLSRNLYGAIQSVFLSDATSRRDRAIRVLDISAYGDRAIAAASLGFDYVGIDPDASLSSGYAALRRDLSMVAGIPKHSLEFNQMPLEAYVCPDAAKVDLFTVSPPPYDMEPYGGSGTRDPQTHVTYTSVDTWARGFLFEIAHRAHRVVRAGGVFAFTALDRTSGAQQIAYVEYLLLLTESMGFVYQGAIGLPSGVPWWTFTAPVAGSELAASARSAQAKELLQQYYPEWYGGVTGALPYPDDSAVLLEVIRASLASYVSEEIRGAVGLTASETDLLLGRWLTAVPRGALDPVFPSGLSGTAVHAANEELVAAMVEKKADRALAERAVYARVYTLRSGDVLYAQTGLGVAGLYATCALFMRFIVNRTAFAAAAREVVVADLPPTTRPEILARTPSAVRFLRHEVPFGGRRDYFTRPDGQGVVVWRGSEPIPALRFSDRHVWTATERRQLALVALRYETLGVIGHHFTRPVRRIEIMNRAVGAPVIDLFANVFNANSSEFASMYPDVEGSLGSIGDFFQLELAASGEKISAYMANPPDTPVVLRTVADRVAAALQNSTRPIVFFVGVTLWHDANPDLLAAFEKRDPAAVERMLAASDNFLASYIVSHLRPFLIAAYRLDTARFPTVLPNGEKRPSRKGLSSIGIVLGSPPRLPNLGALEDLGELVVFSDSPSGASVTPVTYPYRRYFLPAPKVMFGRLRALAETGDFKYSAAGNMSRSYPADYEAADGISNHFTEDVRSHARVGRESPAEVWASMRIAPVDYAAHPDLARRDQQLLYEECARRNSREANIFNAAVAVYFYIWLLKDLKFPVDVLDPSAGWGDRLIAALACGDERVRSYVAFDPNTALQPGYARAIATLSGGSVADASVTALPFEDANLGERLFDIAVTSPPFYDLEVYVRPEDDTDRTQSTTRYKSWKEWLAGMYRPYLGKMYAALRKGGFAVLYVSNYRKGQTTYPLADETKRVLASVGAALSKTSAVETDGPRPREFYVFQKPEPVPPSPPPPRRTQVSTRVIRAAVQPTVPNAVTIRPLERDDAAAVHAFARQPENIAAAGRERSLDNVRAMIDYYLDSTPGNEFFFAVLSGDDVIGYAGFERLTPTVKARSDALRAYASRTLDKRDAIMQVYTSQDVRGSGVFRQAWPLMTTELKASGVRSVVASTYLTNQRAQRAFEALGGERIFEYEPPRDTAKGVVLYRLKL